MLPTSLAGKKRENNHSSAEAPVFRASTRLFLVNTTVTEVSEVSKRFSRNISTIVTVALAALLLPEGIDSSTNFFVLMSGASLRHALISSYAAKTPLAKEEGPETLRSIFSADV